MATLPLTLVELAVTAVRRRFVGARWVPADVVVAERKVGLAVIVGGRPELVAAPGVRKHDGACVLVAGSGFCTARSATVAPRAGVRAAVAELDSLACARRGHALVKDAHFGRLEPSSSAVM